MLMFHRNRDAFFDLNSLQSLVLAELKKSEDFLTRTWYLKLMINLPRKVLDGVPVKMQKHLIHCASNVIAIQVKTPMFQFKVLPGLFCSQ